MSPVGDELFSPYETYIKTLYELYREELEEEDLDKTIKGSHDLLDFQIKNVQALLRRLKKYKVAMLADSVGLGKTYTAIEVIKQYLHTESGQQRIEIICPKSLNAQWEKELAVQGVMNHTPVTLQNPGAIEEKKKLDHIASVSLFVIDESHNLKNRGGKRFDQIIEWIRNNPKAHVLLLTATPINNQLSDIVNQILLGTRGMADVLKVTSVDKRLKQTVQLDFYQAIENLKKKVNQDMTRDGSIDYEHIKQTMMPILRAFVVRRTRQGIEKEYGGLIIAGQERTFPKVFPEVKKIWIYRRSC
jgi:SNF2 family DNA or RNA helicase